MSPSRLRMPILVWAICAGLVPTPAQPPKGRSSDKIPVKATDAKARTKFEVKQGEWIEFDIQGKWRMYDKFDYTGALGHTNSKKINPLGYLGVLVVQIGNGKPFSLSEELPFEAPASGEIYFWPNRQGYTQFKADGELAITVRAGEYLKEKRERFVSGAKKTAEELQADPEIQSSLASINQARKICGLEDVKISTDLSYGCQKHARYLLLNKDNPLVMGLKAHEEQKDLPGYSPEGEKAAKASVIHYEPLSQGTGHWLASFYHRVPLIQPALQEIGIGYYRQGSEWICLVDCLSGPKAKITKDIVFYPEDGQANVPINFGIEIPNPLPAEHKGPAGFPITILFAAGQKVSDVEIKLTGPKDSVVAGYLSTPEKPASSFPQSNAINLIPKQPLAKGMQYQVELRCQLGGKPFARTWRFTTEK